MTFSAENPDSDDNNGKRRNLRPLANLFPYLMNYKMRVVAALAFLVLAAATTLTLPLAVRRMLDSGFTNADSQLIGQYFLALIGIAGLLAI